MVNLFQDGTHCSAYNQALPTNLNTAAVTKMNSMFDGCRTYNQVLPTNFNTAAVTNMSYMFYGCSAFNQNIGTLNIANATSMANIFYRSGISTANYDAILNAWNTAGYTNKNLGDATPLKYCAGAAARTNMIANKGWTINDGGSAAPILTAGIATNPTTCSGTNGSIAFTTNLPNGTYSLAYTGSGSPKSITVASGAFVLIGLSAGTYGNFSVVNNDCPGTDVTAKTLSDPTAPTATASSSTPVICAGNTIALTGGGIGTYAWTGVNSFTSTDQNPSIANASVLASGTYQITVTNVSGCTSTATTSVTVNASPTATASSSTSTICAGNMISLMGGGVGSYTWTGVNSFTSTDQNPSIPNASVLASGTYQITFTNLSGCTSTATTSVTVNASPTATASSSTPIICAGNTILLSGGGIGSYTWTGVNSFTSTDQNPSIPNASILASGTYQITATNVSGCTSTATTSVTVNASPTATASSSTPTICAGNTLSLTGGGIGTYTWTGVNGFTSTDQNPSIPNASILASGTYQITITNLSGCTSTATTSVTVNASPTATASSSTPTICAGNTLLLTGGGIGTYDWTGVNGFTSTDQNPSIPNASVLTSGTYQITVTNLSGCTSTATTSVTVNASPTATASSSTPTICAGNTISLTGGGIGSYAWTGVNGFTSTDQNPSIPNASILASGTYQITVTNVGGCTSTATTSVTVNASPTATASSSTPTICAGNTISLTGGGIGTYAWTGVNGFTSTDQNPSIPNASILASGTYQITVTNVGGCTSTATTSVTVNSTPTTPTPNTIAPISLGNAATLTATGCSGTLKWYKSSDNSLVTNPVSPSITTNYYAKCEVTANGITCESAKSVDVVVTVITVQILYVNVANTNPTQDGTTWANAFSDLQTGLTTATGITGTPVEVWVAKGTYKPTNTTTRTIYFNIPSGVKVYGGFVGTETSITQRDFRTNFSILSGDIGTLNFADDNSYHVVVFNGSSNSTAIDGFTITSGNASFDPKVNGLSLTNNLALGSLPAQTGGGVLINNAGQPIISNCSIIKNTAWFGGGIFCLDLSIPTIRECNISNNEATFGSAIYAHSASNFNMNNVVMAGNRALGTIYNNASNPILTNCTIASNGGYSGGIFNSASQPVVKNSILWGNAGPFNDTQSIITYSTVEGGYPGVGNLTYDPQLVNPAAFGPAPNTVGDYHLKASSLAIDRGNNGSILLTDKDLDGNLRRYVGGLVDMGAYEFQGTATVNLVISVQTGNWETNATWDIGRIPQLSDYVIIDNNHTITLDGTGIAKNLEYRGTGTLKFKKATSKLEIGF